MTTTTTTPRAAALPGPLRLTWLHLKYQFLETVRIPIAVIGNLLFPALAMFFFVVGFWGATIYVRFRGVVFAAVLVGITLLAGPYLVRMTQDLSEERLSASAPRSAPRSPRTCTTPCCRRSR